MNKPIFESEEQAKLILGNYCSIEASHSSFRTMTSFDLDKAVKKLDRDGYIERTPLEKARIDYNGHFFTRDYAENYIEELEKEVVKLKKEK